MLTLYDYYRSSACYRVRIALNLKQLDYQVIPVHLLNNGGEQFSDHYHQLNAQHLVPTFSDNGNVLTQSIAIIEYLNEVYPDHPLLPTDSFLKALVRSFALTIAADIHPLNNLRVLKFLSNEFKISDTDKSTWYQHWIHQGLTALEALLNKHAYTKDFCFGNSPTLADICLIPQLYNAKRFQCDLTAYPTLTRVENNCLMHPDFIKAMPVEPVT